MDSEIDIEEHNLLENPALRAIFPDITALKQELFDYDSGDTLQNHEYLTANENQAVVLHYSKESQQVADLPICSVSTEQLGLDLKFNKQKNEATQKQNKQLPKQNFVFRNKIVLGSKLKTIYNIRHKNQNLSKQAIIVLSDVTPILNSCKRFCRVCSILFPKEDSLIVHRKVVHSEKYICRECGKSFYQQGNLNRHIKNIHQCKIELINKFNTINKKTNIKKAIDKMIEPRVSTVKSHQGKGSCKSKKKGPTSPNVIEPVRRDKVKESKVKENVAQVSCFHCSDKFDSKQLLIEHLYEVLEPKLINKISFPKAKNKTLNKDKHNTDIIETKKGEEIEDTTTMKQTLSYFKCQKCSHYFKNEKLFSKHMMKKHRIRNSLKKRVRFNPKCEFCSHISIHLRMYNRHLHNHHKMNLQQKLKNSKSKGIRLKKQYNKVPNIFIPKSAVFKCSKCDIYFISATYALNHTEHIQDYNWKCNKCNVIFKRSEAFFHMKQHQYAETFNIIDICHDTFSKLLYSCPNCSIHYQDEKNILHYTSCKTSTPQSEYCTFCDILIDSKIKASHINIHSDGNNNKTDFFTIEQVDYVKDRQKIYLERRQRLGFNILAQNLHLYYCKTCKCFVSTLHKVDVHRESNCSQLLRYPCRFCGLFFTGKGIMSHRSMHYKNKLLRLQDFTFYSLDTGKRICPPIPEFSKCDGCNTYLLNKMDVKRHICGKDIDVVCLLCEMKFSETVYKIHLEFHNYVLDNRNSRGELTVMKESKSPKISEIEEQVYIDEEIHLKNTHESDLYCCKICFVHLKTYDAVIEHCQHHLNRVDVNEEIDRNVQCNNIEIGKSSTQIFYFEPFYYGSENEIWLQHVFVGLSSEDINKKLYNSIYRYESRLKLHLTQEGNCEFTEYKCETCQCFINRSSLFNHIDACITNPRKYSCTVCKLPFISKLDLSKHFQMHKILLHVNNICRIVSFNRDTDKEMNVLIKTNPSRPYVVYQCRNCEGLVYRSEFYSHICDYSDLQKCSYCGLLLYSIDYDSHVFKHKQLNSFTGSNVKVILLGFKIADSDRIVNNVSNSFMGIVCDYSFYKCLKCNVCIRDFRCTSKHFCLVDAAKAECEYCGLYFDEGKLKGHIKLHKDDQDFVKNNIITIDFDPKNNKGKDDSKTDKEKEHNESVCMKDQIDVECIGNNEDVYKSNIVEKIGIIYRCAKCNLHFLNKNRATEHVRKRPGRQAKQICTKCGFYFSPNVLFSHLLEHHGNKSIRYTFEVVDVFGNFKKQNLYKCNKCNLHFTDSKKMLEHFSECIGESSEGGKCKCCDLIFHSSCLLNHEKYSDKNAHVDYVVVDAEVEIVNDKL